MGVLWIFIMFDAYDLPHDLYLNSNDNNSDFRWKSMPKGLLFRNYFWVGPEIFIQPLQEVWRWMNNNVNLSTLQLMTININNTENLETIYKLHSFASAKIPVRISVFHTLLNFLNQQNLTSPDSKIWLWFCLKDFFSHLTRIIWRSYVLLVESIMNYMNYANDFRYRIQRNVNKVALNLIRVLKAYTNFYRDSSLIHL